MGIVLTQWQSPVIFIARTLGCISKHLEGLNPKLIEENNACLQQAIGQHLTV